jgi:hypothetical protein
LRFPKVNSDLAVSLLILEDNMNTHQYLRAYMAGSAVPTMMLLVVLSGFLAARYTFAIPIPIERAIIFPMALIPNIFGLWNMAYFVDASAESSVDRVSWRDLALFYSACRIPGCHVFRISGRDLDRAGMVPTNCRPLCRPGRRILPGAHRILLGVEVCGGLFQRGVGDCLMTIA